jgi:2'-5' RNA ligase
MSNLVIVAIPDENDRVWKVSSEKKPHLTLLFLGEADEVQNLDLIMQFVEHAAETTLPRFYLPVDRRGELGNDPDLGPADVLFFKKGRFGYKDVRDFRVQLLKDNNIRTAYDSASQHEGPWVPHLTLGYKNRPAKPDDTDRDYGFYDVAFTKIAVWDADYEGPEFLLKDPWDEWETMEAAPIDVAMSDASEAGEEFMLEHYGVKGMRWGVRKEGEKREGVQRYLDPSGHKLTDDLVKTAIGSLVPVVYPLTIPANIRLFRGAFRGSAAKAQDVIEKRDEKKFEKVAKSQEGFLAIHNGAADHVNKGLEGINKKYTETDLKNPTKKKAYDAEVQGLMQQAYKDSANRIGNKLGTKHLDVEFHNDGNDFAIKIREGQQKPTVETLGSKRVLDTPAGTSSTTKKVIKDHNELTDREFKAKYAVSKTTYAKRVDKYGDPYMNSPMAKIGKKLPGAKHGDMDVELEDVLIHAYLEDDGTVTFTGGVKRGPTGHILGLEFDDFDSNPAIHSAEIGAEFMVFNGLMDPDAFLEHYGTKGMHWGVRKEDVSNAAKSGKSSIAKGVREVEKFVGDVNFESRTGKMKDPETGEDKPYSKADRMVLEATHKEFHKDLKAINDKPEYQKAKKLRNRLLKPFDATTKAYRKETKEAYIKRLETEANKMKNASGTREYTIRERGGDLPKNKYYWEVSTREARHADGADFMLVEVLTDDDGFITGTKTVSAEDAMAHFVQNGAEFLASLGFIGEDELEHYGVKGMRWGVRREREAPSAVTPTAASVVPHGAKRKTKIEVAGGENHHAHEDAIKVAESKVKLKRSGVNALSNKELQDMAKRLQLENQVAMLNSSRATKFIQRQLEQQGQQTIQRNLSVKTAKKVAKKAGKSAATGAVTLALL